MKQSEARTAGKDPADGMAGWSAGKNWLEWLVFAASCLLVGSVLVYLGYQAVTMQETPPDLVVTVGEPMPGRSGTRVPVQVHNHGNSTAENVDVEVVSAGGDRANFNLAFMPRQGRREAWVMFREPVRRQDLRGRVLGYEVP